MAKQVSPKSPSRYIVHKLITSTSSPNVEMPLAFAILNVFNGDSAARDGGAGKDGAGAALKLDVDGRVRAGRNSGAVDNSGGTSEGDSAKVSERHERAAGREVLNDPLSRSTLESQVSFLFVGSIRKGGKDTGIYSPGAWCSGQRKCAKHSCHRRRW